MFYRARVLAIDVSRRMDVEELERKNDVPAQAPRCAWPGISSAIADSAAEGIMEIVDRAKRIPRPR